MANEEQAGEPSIEEIAQAQQAHEEQVNREREEEQQQKEEEERLRARAGSDFEKKGDLMDELRAADHEAKLLEAQGIKHKIADAEKLKGLKSEREENLTYLQKDIDLAADRLQQIEELVAGKDEEMIADVTKKALISAHERSQDLKSQFQKLQEEIQNLNNQIVADEIVNHYTDLLAQCEEHNRQLDELASNPALIDLEHDLAKEENYLRNQIANSAKRFSTFYGGHRTKEKDNYIEQLAQTFMSEYVEGLGINQIKEPAKFKAELNDALSDLLQGLTYRNDQELFQLNDKNADRLRSGLVLRNLVGGYGTLAGTMGFMAMIPDSRPNYRTELEAREQWQKNLPSSVTRYLRTLNLVKSYCTSLEPSYRDKVLSSINVNWKEFDSNYRLFDKFDNRDQSPLVPRDADDALKAKLTSEFEENCEHAKLIQSELKEREDRQKQKDLEEIDSQLAVIAGQLSELEKLEEELKYAPSDYDHESKVRDLENQISRLENEKQRLESEKETLGFLGFRRRNKIDQELSQIEGTINEAKEQLTKWKASKEKNAQAIARQRELGSSFQLRQEINNLNYKKQQLG